MKMRTVFLGLVILSLLWAGRSLGQATNLTPNYFSGMFPGPVLSRASTPGGAQTAWGVNVIGFSWQPSLRILQRLYAGPYLGMEIGMGFAKIDHNLIFKLPLGVAGAYAINSKSFIGFRYFLSTNASTFLQTSKDDGWAYGLTLKYGSLMLEASKNRPGTDGSKLLKARMEMDYWEVFPRYLFHVSGKKNAFWAGIRVEQFKDKHPLPDPGPGDIQKVLNSQFSVGRIF